MTTDREWVDVRFTLTPEEHELLTEVRASGTKGGDAKFNAVVKLYTRMGLLLHKHGIYTLEQLSAKLKRLTDDELALLKREIVREMTPIVTELCEKIGKRKT